MPQFLDHGDADFEMRFGALLNAKREDSPDVDAVVADIIADVRARGDAAVVALTEKFDRIALTPEGLRITPQEVDAATARVDAADRAGLKIKINMVALRGLNEFEINEMLAWCGERGFDLVLIETMPLGEIDEDRTDQYLPETAVAQRTEIINPIRINMRDSSLAVIDRAMREDPEVKIMYASKQARIANAWKKWIGESEGVAKTGGLLKKQKMERQFNERMQRDEGYVKRYGDILPGLNAVYADRLPYAETQAYVGELNYNIDLFRISNILGRLPQ